MAVWIPWARVLVAGDYLSSVEIPTLGSAAAIDAYLETLGRLRRLLGRAEHVVPGHGPVIDGRRALEVLSEDSDYLRALREAPGDVQLPHGRRSKAQRELHAANLAALSPRPRS
jgi:glyoxylase-like metal-dependent hydrolase (beta-lactamase superfamily II)